MTPEQQAAHDRIVQARKVLDEALAAHAHVQAETGCIVCGTTFGHRCPDAPDGRCHYHTVEGSDRLVLMNDGTTVEVQEPVAEEWQNDDSCLFCGEPDERK